MDSLYSVALLKCGSIGAEMGYAKDMRLLLIANPVTFEVMHKCQSDEAALNSAPCWHMAAALDIMAYHYCKTLNLCGNKPLGTIKVVNRYVLNAEGIKDLTPSYLKSRGHEPREGDFKLITLRSVPTEDVAPAINKPAKSLLSGFLNRLPWKIGQVDLT